MGEVLGKSKTVLKVLKYCHINNGWVVHRTWYLLIIWTIKWKLLCHLKLAAFIVNLMVFNRQTPDD